MDQENKMFLFYRNIPVFNTTAVMLSVKVARIQLMIIHLPLSVRDQICMIWEVRYNERLNFSLWLYVVCACVRDGVM